MRLSKKARKQTLPARTAPGGAVVPALLDHKQHASLRIGAMQSLAELHKEEIEQDGLEYNGVESWTAWIHNENRETQRELLKSTEKLLPKQVDATITHGVTSDLLAEIRQEKDMGVLDVEAEPVDDTSE